MGTSETMKSREPRYLLYPARHGSVLLVVLFILALSAALITGMLQLTAEEVLQLRNQIELAKALSVAEAGLHDAIAEIRQDANWNTGFADKVFYADSYTVTVTGSPPTLVVVSTGQTTQGYAARMEARILTGATPPYSVTIESIRINE